MSPERQLNKIGIITKRGIHEHSDHIRCLKRLVKFLKESRKEIIFDTNSALCFKNQDGHRKTTILKKADLVLTLGGDGTLLKTARRLGRKLVYILGVNFGNLGFLTETDPSRVIETLTDIFAGKYQLDRRSLLRVTVYRGKQKLETYLALNDAVINQGVFARLIELDLEVDGRKVVRFKADGMIIATPTGSTAHSLSAGGPIVHPTVEGFTISPICPSSLAMRPIVIPDKKQLTVSIETERRQEHHFIGLTIDGQDTLPLKYGDRVKFRRSSRSLYLIRTKNRYYRVLRSKLGWGQV